MFSLIRYPSLLSCFLFDVLIPTLNEWKEREKGNTMSRRIDAAAVGRILESILFLRSASLTELVGGEKAPLTLPHGSRCDRSNPTKAESAMQSAQEYVRDSILAAVEIEAASPPLTESALTAEEGALSACMTNAGALTEKAWQPRKEIGSALEGRDLHQVDLAGVRLSASFNRSNLADATLVGSYFAHCTFNSCVLRRADLSGGQFHSCTFMSADAGSVKARRAHFSHCVFHRADLCDWDAAGATFFRCSFTMSDLSRWRVDGQTTVITPTDWGRCRRLDWQMKPGSRQRECRVVCDAHAVHARSLGPPQKSACRFVTKEKW